MSRVARHLQSSTRKRGIAPLSLAVACLALLTTLACASPTGSPTPQQPPRVPRIGYLSPGGISGNTTKDAFLQGLADLGLRDGETIQIDFRLLEETDKPVQEIADELAKENLDLIVAVGTARAQAVKNATQTMPIVMASVVDPVQAGLVTSLARPGGNVTGVSTVTTELSAKRLELLKDALPTISRVAVLATPRWREASSPIGLQWSGVDQAAKQLGIQVQLVEVVGQSRDPETLAALERAIETAAGDGAEALYPLSDALFDTTVAEIAQAALRNRLPAVYRRPDFVEYGGLLAYGPNPFDELARVASYVDKIIRGARPEDLPVSLPTRFDLVINLQTARTLGIRLSDPVLAQAGRVID